MAPPKSWLHTFPCFTTNIKERGSLFYRAFWEGGQATVVSPIVEHEEGAPPANEAMIKNNPICV